MRHRPSGSLTRRTPLERFFDDVFRSAPGDPIADHWLAEQLQPRRYAISRGRRHLRGTTNYELINSEFHANAACAVRRARA